jgi:hypothetical protein
MREDQPAVTLRRLRADYPQMMITAEFCGRTRVWVARGGDGRHLWLVLSSDLGRFRSHSADQPRLKSPQHAVHG